MLDDRRVKESLIYKDYFTIVRILIEEDSGRLSARSLADYCNRSATTRSVSVGCFGSCFATRRASGCHWSFRSASPTRREMSSNTESCPLNLALAVHGIPSTGYESSHVRQSTTLALPDDDAILVHLPIQHVPHCDGGRPADAFGNHCEKSSRNA
jgi:hypothetical protein